MFLNRTAWFTELLGKDNWQIFNTENEQKEKLIYLIKNKDKCLDYGQKGVEKAKTFNVDDYVDELHILDHQYAKMFLFV